MTEPYKRKFQESYYENDLSHLGNKELKDLAKLLTFWSENKITHNAHNNMGKIEKFGFNGNSGYVFLIDDNYNTFMDNGSHLDIWLSCPYGGDEGFPEEFNGNHEDDYNQDDVDYLKNFGEFGKDGKFKAHS
jgi:hypothetical protein